MMMSRVKVREKLRINGQSLINIKHVHVENIPQIHPRMAGRKKGRVRIEPADAVFQVLQFLLGDQIAFIKQDEIRHPNLFGHGFGLLHLLADLFGVNDSDNRVQAHKLRQSWYVEKGLGNGAGIRDACGFDKQVIEPTAVEKLLNAAHQILPHRATDATIIELDDLLFRILNQLTINSNGANFIDQDAKLVVTLRLENVIEQRGLSGAKKTGQDGGWYGIGGIHKISVMV